MTNVSLPTDLSDAVRSSWDSPVPLPKLPTGRGAALIITTTTTTTIIIIVVVVVVVVVVVGITACRDLCVFNVFSMCIKTTSAPRLHEVLVR